VEGAAANATLPVQVDSPCAARVASQPVLIGVSLANGSVVTRRPLLNHPVLMAFEPLSMAWVPQRRVVVAFSGLLAFRVPDAIGDPNVCMNDELPLAAHLCLAGSNSTFVLHVDSGVWTELPWSHGDPRPSPASGQLTISPGRAHWNLGFYLVHDAMRDVVWAWGGAMRGFANRSSLHRCDSRQLWQFHLGNATWALVPTANAPTNCDADANWSSATRGVAVLTPDASRLVVWGGTFTWELQAAGTCNILNLPTATWDLTGEAARDRSNSGVHADSLSAIPPPSAGPCDYTRGPFIRFKSAATVLTLPCGDGAGVLLMVSGAMTWSAGHPGVYVSAMETGGGSRLRSGVAPGSRFVCDRPPPSHAQESLFQDAWYLRLGGGGGQGSDDDVSGFLWQLADGTDGGPAGEDVLQSPFPGRDLSLGLVPVRRARLHHYRTPQGSLELVMWGGEL
jgi:hypothetical protein